MDNSLLTPIELSENPELGALRILKTTLDVAELALLASYPDCREYSGRRRSEQEAYAIAILYQIDALAVLVNEYAESLRRVGWWRYQEASKEDMLF